MSGRDRTPDDGGQRLRRADADRGESLSERLVGRYREWHQHTFLHRLKLRGAFPLRLLSAPPDLWPGSAERGRDLLAGRFAHLGHQVDILTADLQHLTAPEPWLDWFHSFVWLRDLSAVDRKASQTLAEGVIQRWIDAFDKVHRVAWRPDLTGERLRLWIGHAPMVLSSGNQVYRSAVLNAIARGSRHLAHTVTRVKPGLARLQAASGLLVSGLLLPGGSDRAQRGTAALVQELERFVLPDGGVASRSPADMLDLLRLLLSVRQVFADRGAEEPQALGQALDRLGPGVLAMRMGDGRLACFNGGGFGDTAMVEATLAHVGARTRPLRNGAHCGFQRLDHGRTIVVMDAGPPPSGRIQHLAHAGALSFEFSDGAERVVVNCGGGLSASTMRSPTLATMLRTTAAHSTLIIGDTNSTQLRSDGNLGKGIDEVTVLRDDGEEGTVVDAAHDGYALRHGFIHRRRLFLSRDGMDLRGEDSLAPASGKRARKTLDTPFDIRFHLAHGIEATFTHDGQGAVIRLPGGTAWMFKVKGASLSLTDSLWIGPDGLPHKVRQLVASGVAPAAGGAVKWSFKRSGKH